MRRVIASFMLLSMHNGSPINSDSTVARQEQDSLQAARPEAMPDAGTISPDEAPAIAQSPEATAAAGSHGESEIAPAPATSGIGVLIVNLGTPDAPTSVAVRRYLKEFLTDRRVIEKNS